MGRLAILAGGGALSVRLAQAVPDAVQISFSGVPHELGSGAKEHAFEKLGTLFDALKADGVTEIVMAGAMSRPPLNPAEFDATMMGLAPRLMMAMQVGDDAILKLVVEIFEEQGFVVKGAHEVDPSLTAQAGCLTQTPLSKTQQSDADRAVDILSALSPLDVGQGVVVENGLCLGIETLQGTDALLGFVAETEAHLRKGAGVFVKAPKRGQDLRVDMPTIGPDTIRAVQAAKLSAIVIASGAVIILERAETLALANDAGIALIAQDL